MLSAKAVAGLAGLGVEITVISLRDAARADPRLEALVPGSVRQVTVPSRAGTLLWRAARKVTALAAVPDAEVASRGSVLRAALREVARQRPDAVMTWSQWHSAALVGLDLKRRTGLPWLAHFSDPWNDGPYVHRRALAARLSIRMERAVLEAADAVTYVAEQTRQLVAARLPAVLDGKAGVIPHCYDPRLYAAPAPRSGGLVFRYVGAFYGPRTPLPLLHALSAIAASGGASLEGVRFEFVGRRAPEWASWRAAAAAPDCVHDTGEVSYLESLRLMTDADFLVTIDAAGDDSVFLPSKLVDYLGAGRPLLAITPPKGPSAELVRATGGLVVDPRDVGGIASAVSTLVAAGREGRLGEFWKPAPALLAKYSVSTTARQRLDALERAIRRVRAA